MSRYFIKNVRLLNSDSSLPTDITIVDSKIESGIPEGAEGVMDAGGSWLVPTLAELWVDPRSPKRNDIYSYSELQDAMLRGGYQFALADSADNCCDDTGLVHDFSVATAMLDTEVIQAGAVTVGHQGTELTEMITMQQMGISALTTGAGMPQNTGVLRSVMVYAAQTGMRLFILPAEESFCLGAVHEGVVADTLGMQGSPVEAEEIAVFRCLKVAELSGCALHFRHITSKKSLLLIQESRERGLDVTCDVGLYHLLFDDKSLFDLNSALHLPVPLRDTRKELWEALWNGQIDAISCGHIPCLPQDKQTYFEDSLPGAIGLETSLSALHSQLLKEYPEKSWKDLLPFLSDKPREILGSQAVSGWFLWDPETDLPVLSDSYAGYVENSPLLGKTLKGKVLQTLL